jgi:hypothetical protein
MANARPYLAGAFICEKVLREKDDVLSAIRIVDTFFIEEHALKHAGELEAGVPINVLLMLKSGDIVGESVVRLKVRSPSNKTVEIVNDFAISLKGGESGANLHITILIRLKDQEFGLFWIDVFWNGEVLTSIPFKLVRGPNVSGQEKN